MESTETSTENTEKAGMQRGTCSKNHRKWRGFGEA